jgi:hypothetical protein
VSYLERTPDVQRLLAQGSHIIEMRFDENKRPVERLVAVADVTVPKKEREGAMSSKRASEHRDPTSGAPPLPSRPLSVAEVRRLYPHALGKERGK